MTMLFALCLAGAETPEAPDATEAVEEARPEGPDRSAPPPVLEPEPLDLDEPRRSTLSNGVELLHVRIPRLRSVLLRLDFWRGPHGLGVDPDAAQMLDTSWGVASARWSPSELEKLTVLHDISLDTTVDEHRSTVQVEVPTEHLEVGLDLLADVALHPVFPRRELRIAKDELERFFLMEAPHSPDAVAQLLSEYAFFPADHPYGRRFDLAAFLAQNGKTVRSAHRTLIGARPVSLLVVGAPDDEQLRPLLEQRFGSLPPSSGEREPPLPFPPLENGRVLAVAMPGSDQVAIRMERPAPSYADPATLAVDAASWTLVGHFLARLNANLREEKGWTYGVRGGYEPRATFGRFRVGVDVPGEHFAAAVREIESELDRLLEEGPTDEELRSWWRAAVKTFNDTRGSTATAERFYGSLLERDESVRARRERLEAMRRLTPDQVREAARAWLDPSRPTIWIAVGPRDALQAGFDALGWEPEWVEPRDAVLGLLPGDPRP